MEVFLGDSGFSFAALQQWGMAIALLGVLYFAASLRVSRLKTARLRATLNRIEGLAKIGHWHYDTARARQYWSPQMRRIYGLDETAELTTKLCPRLGRDGGDFLWQSLECNAATRDSFRIEYDIVRPDGCERLLRIDALNTFDEQGALRFIDAVICDVTDEYPGSRQIVADRTAVLVMAAQAREMSMIDPLTGLANNRKAMGEIDRRIQQCRTQQRKLSIIVFDLDHFSAINEMYGHAAGDAVLKRVAEIALNQVRDSDLVARVGGEMFIWLLPDACADIVSIAAERLRRAIEGDGWLPGLPAVTASIGYACCHAGDTGLALFAAADAARRRAKLDGRNQVRMAA